MGVTEIGPGLFRSSIEIEDQANSIEFDLGCYADQGHAEVACDVMLLKLRGRVAGGDGRRLPKLDRADEAWLFNSLETYEHITKQLLKELGDRKEEDLAVALKSHRLAAALHSKLPGKGEAKKGALGAGPSTAVAPPAPGASNAKRKQAEAPAAEPAAKKAAVAPVKPALKKVVAVPVPAPVAAEQKEEKAAKKVKAAVEKAAKPQKVQKKEKDQQEEEEEEERESSPEPKPKPKAKPSPKEKAPAPKKPKAAAAGGGAEGAPEEPKVIWIRGSPEWPPGSGQFPCLVKSGPYRIGYFTLAVGMVRAVLPAMQHGPITMVDAGDPSRSWEASYIVKEEEHRVPGDFSGSRYFRQLREVQAGLGMEPGDVFFCMRDEQGEPQRVRVGIWKKGSQRAEAFTAKLLGG